MRRFLEYIIVCVMVIISSSCNIDEEITTSLPPKIIIDGSGSYRVRLGDELRLAPRYENGDEASYSWSIEGVELSNQPTYTFTAQSKGLTKILLTVSNTSGSDSRTFSITTIDRFMVYDYTPAPGQSRPLRHRHPDGAEPDLEKLPRHPPDPGGGWHLRPEDRGGGAEIPGDL